MNYEIVPQAYFERLGLCPETAFSLSASFTDKHNLHDAMGAPEALLLDYAIERKYASKDAMKPLLIEACQDGDLIATCMALSHIPPNFDCNGQTPLHLARRFPGVVLALLEYGADVDALDFDDLTVLARARREGLTETVLILLARGARI